MTVGDPAGIGPEIVAAALAADMAPPDIDFCVYGDIEAVERAGPLPQGVARRPFQSSRVTVVGGSLMGWLPGALVLHNN